MGDTYEGTFSDIYRLQSQTSAGVAERSGHRSPSGASAPPAAHVRRRCAGQYAQGRAFLERPDLRARTRLPAHSAVGRDPRFASAHAALADAYLRKQVETRDLAWALKARDSMMTALTLAPDDSTLARAEYDGALREVSWKIRGDELRVSYRIAYEGAADILGISFDYPEKDVLGKRWVGEGDYD